MLDSVIAETVTPQAEEEDSDFSEGPVIPPLEELQVSDRGGLFLPDDEPGAVEETTPAAPETPAEAAPAATATAATPKPDPEPAQPAEAPAAWRPSREKVIWLWPAFHERLVEDLD